MGRFFPRPSILGTFLPFLPTEGACGTRRPWEHFYRFFPRVDPGNISAVSSHARPPKAPKHQSYAIRDSFPKKPLIYQKTTHLSKTHSNPFLSPFGHLLSILSLLCILSIRQCTLHTVHCRVHTSTNCTVHSSIVEFNHLDHLLWNVHDPICNHIRQCR